MAVQLKGFPELMAELATAPQAYRPSPFWKEMVAVGVKQIENAGFENFKRTVNMTYFCWDLVGILRHQLTTVAGHWLTHPRWRVFEARFPNYVSPFADQAVYYTPPNFRVSIPEITSFNSLGAWAYKLYVAMLWENVRERDTLNLLGRLDEPLVGNPFLIHYQGRETSQDLCNSVHEFYSMGGETVSPQSDCSVAELGGGYGRLAYVWLSALPKAKYCLIDIAPALNIAQEYLSQVFPNEKIFYFRPFQKYEDIREEFESARIRFLASHQIELLPAGQFDFFANISSLHEMSYEQIVNYLGQIGRVCRGRFYSKQWRRSQAAVNGMIISEHEYPIPKSWEELYHSPHPIQKMFFHALYRVPGVGSG